MTQVFHKPVRVILPKHVDQKEFWTFVREKMLGETHFVMHKKRELLACSDLGFTKIIGNVEFIPCLLVSYRDASVVAKMQKNALGKRTVSVPDSTAQVMDFNYILISKNNGMAIYQHYNNAASPQVFEDVLKRIYNEYKKVPEQSEIDALDPTLKKGKRTSEIRNINSKWRKSPEVRIICDSQNELERVLSEWSKVSSFTYRLSAFSQNGTNWTPLSKLVRMQTQKVTFVPNTKPLDVARAVLGIKNELQLGSFRGVDETNAERSLDIFDLPKNLATFDFDKLRVKLDGLVLEDFHNSSVFKWLEDTILPRIADFRDPIEDE